MCGRYALANPQEIKVRFNTQNTIQHIQPSFNIAPETRQIVVVRHSPNTMEQMRWSLIPRWSKTEDPELSLINKRSEDINEKPYWRELMATHRCLIPATGFFEWKNTAKGKQPFYIHLLSRPMFAFAGLWDSWKSPEGNEITSFLIITTQPNDVMKPIHHRMPVILEKEFEDAWVDPGIKDVNKLAELLNPYDAGNMEAYPIRPWVNNPSYNSDRVLERLEEVEDTSTTPRLL